MSRLPRLILISVISLLFLYVCLPFLSALALSAVFALFFYPLQRALLKLKLSPYLASLILTTGLTVLVLLPLAFFIYWAAITGVEKLGLISQLSTSHPGVDIIHHPNVTRWLGELSKWFPLDVASITTTLEDLTKRLGMGVAAILGRFFSNLPGVAVSFAVVVVSLFFFLVDGPRLLFFIKRFKVMEEGEMDRLFYRLEAMSRSVILATVASGASQSVFFTIGVLIVGVAQAPLIALLVFLASFVPLIGSLPVTLAVTGYQFVIGETGAGVFLLVMGIITTMVDNVIRAAVLKGGADLHPLLAFLAAFGGLKTMGPVGIFLGPVIAGLFVAMVELLQEARASAPR